MLPPHQVEALIRERFADAIVQLRDLTGTQDHYELQVASDEFEGVPPVKQHRLVYAALGEHMRSDIHALALKTYTLKSAPDSLRSG